MLTSVSLAELPMLFYEDRNLSEVPAISTISSSTSYSKADIQRNYEKEQLWRLAISKGDIRSAKKIFRH